MALDKAGNVQIGFPTEAYEEDLGDYFFYPPGQNNFIDICVRATTAKESIDIARSKAREINKAGKWGIDTIK